MLLLNLHSMTPQLTSEAELRPWHISVLSRHDRRVADPLIARLAAEPELAGAVGDNEPYSLRTIRAHTLAEHAQPRGLPHVAVEIRQVGGPRRASHPWASTPVSSIGPPPPRSLVIAGPHHRRRRARPLRSPPGAGAAGWMG